eukprot:CAMPEP_0118923774 /NCGR_PEP_ID=MMETSP1169-20130426/2179_1 /TAXON_ID=36882 /ORGANISM="Pyramimonas obovata, Strain CCMP722" /LENGTH=150 /DNA_ID=CAMNT_0006864815 /DNA_START=148 /DNA_END=601 /DNA_ORIENTATION=+
MVEDLTDLVSDALVKYGLYILGALLVLLLLRPYIERYFVSLRARALESGESNVEFLERQRLARRQQQENASKRQEQYLEEERVTRAQAAEKRLEDLDKKAEYMGFKPQGKGRRLDDGESTQKSGPVRRVTRAAAAAAAEAAETRAAAAET